MKLLVLIQVVDIPRASVGGGVAGKLEVKSEKRRAPLIISAR